MKLKVVIRFLLILLLLVQFFWQPLYAQSTKSYEGVYTGSAYRILMNGEPKEARNMVFTLHNGVLTAVLDKLGKMPGSVHFRISGVTLASDGKLATSSANAGEIHLLGLFSPTLEWDADSGDPFGAFHGTLRTINGVKTLELHLNVTSLAGFSRKKAKFSFLGALK